MRLFGEHDGIYVFLEHGSGKKELFQYVVTNALNLYDSLISLATCEIIFKARDDLSGGTAYLLHQDSKCAG